MKLIAETELPKLDESPIKELLGPLAPRLDASPRSRIRLTTALRYKFGEGYANIPAVSDVLAHFDDHRAHVREFVRIKGGIRG